MNTKQKLTWLIIGLQLLALACATSQIGDADGARTLTRGTLGFITLLCIREFWMCVPEITRRQARDLRTQRRINRTQRKYASRRVA